MNINLYQDRNILKIIDLIENHNGDIIIFCNKRDSDETFKLIKFIIFSTDIIYFPSKENDPYEISNFSYTENSFSRVLSLSNISMLGNKKKIIISDYENIFYRYQKNLNDLFIEFPNNYSREDLINKLISFGFFRNSTILSLNDFTVNGEVIDIHARNGCFKIIYEWDKISNLYAIDHTDPSIKQPIERFIIIANNEMTINENALSDYNSRSSLRKYLHSSYQEFFDKPNSIFNILNNPIIISNEFFTNFINIYNNFIIESYNNFVNSNKQNSILEPNKLFFLKEDINLFLDQYKLYQNNFFSENKENKIQLEVIRTNNTYESIFLDSLNKNKNLKQVLFYNDSNEIYLRDLLESQKILTSEIYSFDQVRNGIVNLLKLDIKSGFIYKDLVFYSSTEFFGKIKSQIKKSKNKQLKNILIDINNFEYGEYIVHSDYGIGIFRGSEIITALGIKHECVKLEYLNNDVLYVPVENIDSITKYGNKEFAELDKLGTTAWQRKKASLKQKSFEYAQKLIEVAAKRSLIKSYDFALDNDLFNSFINKFPYIETEDQINSTNDILLDLNSSILMDRLICGDVGYGKTEIAMRAAFAISKANLLGNRMVVIVVPTTILCQQHYMSFRKRFASFDVNIVTLSRNTSRTKLLEIKEEIKNQKVDIVIGTHAVFSDNIEFPNLGLLIIDEEHNFGVKQKEKIKILNPHIHILSMSATPIPRSLQMSLTGLRDLSIIATPPIGRKNIEIDIIHIDFHKIREIILKKVSNGGVALFVAPRIDDLGEIAENLRKYIPEMEYRIAHGQMDQKEIEIIMEDFHKGLFEILLCTTIVGSGIDIKLANNIIIYRADMFGLSQLYQLKGRVGRSDMESSAFLAVSDSISLKYKTMQRIEVMKNLNHSGGVRCCDSGYGY
jgi:transcription-repair coupling factor (superfamily II helicase)